MALVNDYDFPGDAEMAEHDVFLFKTCHERLVYSPYDVICKEGLFSSGKPFMGDQAGIVLVPANGLFIHGFA